VPGPTAEEVDALTRAQRAGASATVAGDLLEVYYRTDVRPLLAAIGARTAVLHREADPATRFELGREVASLIPGATLIPLPGSSHLFYHGAWAEVLAATLGFFADAGPAPSGPRLTGRELEVAGLVSEGLTNHSIAVRLSIAHGRGACREHPAQAGGALARPDRGVGDRAPAERRDASVVRVITRTTGSSRGGSRNRPGRG
jgi:hypothetical protein